MTEENKTELEKIKHRVYGRDCETAYDKIHTDRNWLIAQLETAEARIKELEGILSRLIDAADAYSADQTDVDDLRCGNVQPVSVKEALELNSAIAHARQLSKSEEVKL